MLSLFSASILGSLFKNFNLTFDSSTRNITVNVNLVDSHAKSRHLEDAQGKTDSTKVLEENQSDVGHGHDQTAAPFSVDTTLVFDDHRIKEWTDLTLPKINVLVLYGYKRRVAIKNYPPYTVIRESHGTTIGHEGGWSSSNDTKSPKVEHGPEGENVEVPGIRLISQARQARYSVSLYYAPLGETIIINGQKCVFTKAAYREIYISVLRSHVREKVFVRNMSVVAVPS